MAPLRYSLIEFFREHTACLAAYSVDCRIDAAKGSVHRLRVTLKNLKGLMVLLYDLDPDNKGKPGLPPHLRELFIVTGRLRDMQVLEAELLVQETGSRVKFPGIRSLLLGEKRCCQDRIEKVLGDLSCPSESEAISQYLYRVISHYSTDGEIEERISKYMQRTWKKILALFTRPHTVENLHRIRIRIRNLNSALAVIGPDSRIHQALPFAPKDLRVFQQLLGKWHDVAVFREKVREYSEHIRGRDPRAGNLEILMQGLTLKQRNMKRRIQRFMKRLTGD
ncbi:MAG TPA: CHAD domain-containing protein [Bacteroidales bacterium]|nr:CHAD domain-containing protein [Bacteroidales bacterium]